jgi:hypothetical protein
MGPPVAVKSVDLCRFWKAESGLWEEEEDKEDEYEEEDEGDYDEEEDLSWDDAEDESDEEI